MKIETLEIYSKNLRQQTQFYSEILGLELIAKEQDSVSFQVGNAVLKLVHNEKFTPYHFAMNIPSNKASEALVWLKKRVDILKEDDIELHYFEPWNAHNIYFYDKDNNIVELIAKEGLGINSSKVFDADSILNISEIGLATVDINQEFEILKNVSKLNIHYGTTERFCAIGDEEGMFIVINKKLKTEWFPTNDKPFSSPFKISFKEKGKPFNFEYQDEILKNL